MGDELVDGITSHDPISSLEEVNTENKDKLSQNMSYPFTPKISLEVLLTVCSTILMMLVQRIWF